MRSVIINQDKKTVVKGPKFCSIGPFNTIDDVLELKGELSKESFDSLYQTIFEKELWETEKYQDILCPIIRFFPYLGIVEMNYIEPIMTREKSELIGEEDAVSFLTKIVLERGGTELEVLTFINRVLTLCRETNLSQDDVLNNLSNIGYNKEFGLRIIDYGFSNELEEFYNV